jgi:two-component system, response regulator YesN
MDWRVTKLKEALDSHAGGIDCNLKQLCRESGLEISPAYAGQLFKRETGQSMREYAKAERLSLAEERLTTTDVPIKVIAGEFGYKSAFHFGRIFKNRYHLSPSEFRRAKHASQQRAV